MPSSRDATEILREAARGSSEAVEGLLCLVYEELRGIAEHHLRHERPDHTLQATELVHETYLRLVDQTRCDWQNRAHFLAVASRAMRRILVDHARSRMSGKRGGGTPKLPLEEALTIEHGGRSTTLLGLDRALGKLCAQYPDIGRLVEMRFFGGLTLDECAAVLGVSPRTVSRNWEFARAWLHREVGGDAAAG